MFDRSVGASGAGGSPATHATHARVGRSPRVARADRVSDIRRSELRIEAMVLRDAASWAIEHGVDETDPFATGPAGGAGKFVGSDGTPWIDEHVAKEYGALRGTSTFEATDLIVDALDLRHRLPRLWRAVRDLRVRVRFARKISKACRDLSWEAAAAVDAELARKPAWGLPWARLEKILAAAIINADPELHERKLAAARFDRRVWLSESEDGLRTMVIRADEGDQVLLFALIERIAEILGWEGDTDPVDQRRSKAAGWLARPEDLIVLLYRHAGGAAPQQPARDEARPAAADDARRDQPQEPGGHTDGSHTDCDDNGDGDNGDDDNGDDDNGDDDNYDERIGEEGSAEEESADQRPSAKMSDPTEGGGVDGGEADAAVAQPPDDFPGFDWVRPEPPFDPGVSDRLPKPRSRWFGTEHLPGPGPYAPAWCYQPPDDLDDPPPPIDPQALGPPGSRLGCDLPRLVDYLTAKGLKPARPRVNLTVHLTDQTLLTGQGVVRSQECGPMLLSQLVELLGRHHCTISLRPVVDPANLAAVDSYEIPQVLRDAVRARHPASVFPFSARTGQRLDLDHTVPHTHAPEPPGQTRVGNLGPLARPEHRAKTAGVWHVEQPHPGVFLWRSPHGYWFLVTNQGTQALGPRPDLSTTEPIVGSRAICRR